MIRIYNERIVRVKPLLNELLNADTVEQQRKIYDAELREKFWTGLMKFTMNRDTTMSMLGVPKAQRRQIENQYPGGLVKFIQECMESCLLYTSPSPRDATLSRMPSSA